ncbi:MAG: zinc-ribbon domain-containing protein [Clostridia bacterium]
MTYCKKCGTQMEDGVSFCPQCGAAAEAKTAPAYAPAQQPNQNTVMSLGSYLGTLLLMGLPIAGFILTIVWACGGCENKNKINLSRAMLIIMAIGVVISIIFIVFFSAAAVSMAELAGSSY